MPEPSTVTRLRALGPRAPRLRFGLAWPRIRASDYRRVFPFQRHRPAIALSAVILAVFAFPLFNLPRGSLTQSHDLSALTGVLFVWCWTLGWSVGVGLIALVFLALASGREVVQVAAGQLDLRVDICRIGLGAAFNAVSITNLRAVAAAPGTAHAWRGAHLAFDYLGVTIAFGSAINDSDARTIIDALQRVLITPSHTQTEPDPVVTAMASIGADRLVPPNSSIPITPPSRAALTGLLAANLVPLAGVLLLGWDIGNVMLVYWAESAIIGVFNLLKLAVVARWAVIVYGPFFLGHFGGFMTVHLLFIYAFFIHTPHDGGLIPLGEVAQSLHTLSPALLGLSLSHGLSFVQNFLGRGEYRRTTTQAQMTAPYQRVIVMHLTIIFGGMLSLVFTSALPALVLLIATKIAVDVYAHRRERGRYAE